MCIRDSLSTSQQRGGTAAWSAVARRGNRAQLLNQSARTRAPVRSSSVTFSSVQICKRPNPKSRKIPRASAQ
eukprot:6472747-Alexandrium_andersonii.AAC.1